MTNWNPTTPAAPAQPGINKTTPGDAVVPGTRAGGTWKAKFPAGFDTPKTAPGNLGPKMSPSLGKK